MYYCNEDDDCWYRAKVVEVKNKSLILRYEDDDTQTLKIEDCTPTNFNFEGKYICEM